MDQKTVKHRCNPIVFANLHYKFLDIGPVFCSKLVQCHQNLPQGSVLRLAIVLAFAVTPYGAIERPWKPFNPILGETFELHCGNNVQFLAEQVRKMQNLCTSSFYCLHIMLHLLLYESFLV